MSLINDALKRAREAQQQATPPPSPPPPFRPVESPPPARHGLGLLLPAALAVVALLVLFFAWQWVQGRTTGTPQEARALTPSAPLPTVAPDPASLPMAAPPVEPGLIPQSPAGPASAADTATSTAGSGPATPDNPPLAQDQAGEATNSAPAVPPPAPEPPPLRLQAIVFNPKRPSAQINGKTLFLGERLGDARVVAIDENSATLVGAGKTNILTLPE